MFEMENMKNQIQIKQNSYYKKGKTVKLERNGPHILVHLDQVRSKTEHKDVENDEYLGKEEQEETYDFNRVTEQGMEERDNESLEETDEENELRPSSPL